ncbi:hypothetical protein ZTR_01191 [Talaromyces verruculosus]|nr:hypothetical protein ZTR_01191 [Talaromyces verruculosus]
MAAHNPVIPVNRSGYQAIVAVQLAHVKTPAERIFAKQKALSWPPWKEARMGIDAERGNEGMRSRTMQVLSQMVEAGYALSSWDDVAAILAGWDTDGTPTIQTRSLARPQKSLEPGTKESKVISTIWASRIRATRTLREAWACFLSYETRAFPSEPVYHAMARKLIYRMEESDDINTKNGPLPGDGFEVYPEPSSARDVTYVPTEPPTLEELLERMILQGVLPGVDFIALLVRFSPDFSTGLRYIAAFLSPKQTKAVSTLYIGDLEGENLVTLKAMKPSLFDSIIAFFCTNSQLPCPGHRFRKVDLFPILMQRPSQLLVDTSTFFSDEDVLRKGNGHGHPQILSHAVELLLARRPRRVTAWIPLLKALASPRGPSEERLVKPHVHWYFAWYEASEVIHWMQELGLEPGMEGFIVLCQIFAQAVGVGIQSIGAAEESLYLAHRTKRQNDKLHVNIAPDFESFVYQGIRVLKSYFDRLVLPIHPVLVENQSSRSDTGESSLPELPELPESIVPDMIQVPTPAALHTFVRALGTAEDHDGILNLLEWMSRYASEIAEAADQKRGGRKMLRRTLTAMRVYLEDLNALKMPMREPEPAASGKATLDSYYHTGEQEDDIIETRPIFADGRVEEAYEIIESTAVWGSWPSDDEVRAYVARLPMVTEGNVGAADLPRIQRAPRQLSNDICFFQHPPKYNPSNNSYKMPPRGAIVFSILRPTRSTTASSSFSFSRASTYFQIRPNSTAATSEATGSTINVQQVPAPGSGYVRVLLLNRPKARNAISKELLNALRFQVDAISAEQGNGPTRALVLASNADSAFCAGADLKERKGMSKEETNAFLTKLRGTLSRLEALPIPTISAISSVALGGGLELALSTQLRVFGSTSTVGLPETRIAIIPGAGGTYRLPKLIGLSRARDLILTGRKVTGAEAYFLGICDRLVEITPEEEKQEGVARNKVLHEGVKLALDICEGGPLAIKAALQAVNQYEKGEEAENAAYDTVVETEDRLEALLAFAEKRKPVYRGR